ncbi:MAG: hypothetical protein ABIM03_05945 [candidate division WOR-3 bacterium]
MRRLFLILTLMGTSFAGLQVGDVVDYYMNVFRLIMVRDTIPRKGVVRYVGSNFYLISGDKVSVTKIVKRKYSTQPVNYIAGTKRVAGKDPQYIYLTTDLIKWRQNRALSGADAKVDQDTTPMGDLVNTYDLDVYDIVVNPTYTSTSFSTMYIASEDGLFCLYGSLSAASWIAMPDTPVFSVVFHPDSTGPIPPITNKEILFIGTAKGVYHVTVNIKCISNVETLAICHRVGNLTDSVFAVGVDPNNDKIRYAGTSNKLYKWDSLSSNWQQVLNLTGKARRIKFFDSQTIVVTTKDGFWYTEDGGSNWTHKLENKDCWEIEYAYGYYWIVTAGEGVLRSTSLSGDWSYANEGLESLAMLGSKECYAIFYDSTQNNLLIGNDQGVWKWDGGKWVNISKGIGSIIPDTEVQSLADAVENPFGNGRNLFDSLKTVLQVSDVELWDIDNDPHIYIVLTGIIYSADLQDPTLTPIYGYFDPFNEDLSQRYSNKKEIFFVDLSYFYDPVTGEINKINLAKFMGYLFNQYAIWSLDRNESRAVREGLAITALHLAGFEVFNPPTNVGIVGGRQWGSSPDRINMPLLSYTTAWLNSPVAREMDRERVGYFVEYLREKFGNSIFYDILRDKQHDGYEVFDYQLNLRNYKFEKILCEWAIANLIDNPAKGYGYPEIDNIFDYSQFSQYATEIPEKANNHSLISPCGIVYLYKNGMDTIYHLDFQDNFGDTLKGFKLFRILLPETSITEIQFDTLKIYEDTMLIVKNAKNVVSDRVSGNVRYVIVNASRDLTGYYAASYEKDPPKIYSSYILQNPAVTHSLDFYALSKDYFYGDANTASQANVYIVPLQKGMPRFISPLKFIGKGDTTFVFNSKITLTPNVEGDLRVYSYGQNLVGIYTVLYDDTISIRKLKGSGIYSFLNGRISIEIPQSLDYHGVIMVSKVYGKFQEEDEKYTIGSIYSVGNSKIVFPSKIKIIIRDELYKGRNDISLYTYDGKKWVECESYLNSETGEIIACVDRLGIFAVRTGNPVVLKMFSFSLNSSNLITGSSKIKFTFSLPSTSSVSISLFDVTGREVYFKDLKTLSPGLYNDELKFDKPLSKGVYMMRFKAVSKHKEYNKLMKIVLF